MIKLKTEINKGQDTYTLPHLKIKEVRVYNKKTKSWTARPFRVELKLSELLETDIELVVELEEGVLKQYNRSMKKTPLKRKSKSKTKKYQDKLWELCKQIIRLKYGNKCYTCNAVGLEGSNWQTGHMWAKASLSSHLKYDLRVLRPQCMRCNCHMGGMGADFIENMRRIEGDNYVDTLQKERNILIKADDKWYEDKIAEYKEILSELQQERGS